jgi:hypothetical protein
MTPTFYIPYMTEKELQAEATRLSEKAREGDLTLRDAERLEAVRNAIRRIRIASTGRWPLWMAQ